MVWKGVKERRGEERRGEERRGERRRHLTVWEEEECYYAEEDCEDSFC
jgi:hypothetical protein